MTENNPRSTQGTPNISEKAWLETEVDTYLNENSREQMEATLGSAFVLVEKLQERIDALTRIANTNDLPESTEFEAAKGAIARLQLLKDKLLQTTDFDSLNYVMGVVNMLATVVVAMQLSLANALNESKIELLPQVNPELFLGAVGVVAITNFVNQARLIRKQVSARSRGIVLGVEIVQEIERADDLLAQLKLKVHPDKQ